MNKLARDVSTVRERSEVIAEAKAKGGKSKRQAKAKGAGRGTHKQKDKASKRRMETKEIAVGLARTIAEKMAKHAVPFSGTGHRLDEPRQKMKGEGHRGKKLPVRMDRAGVARAGTPLVA